MRDATIATSRTRATSDHLIDYRPLPASWGDLDALHALRAEKSRAAARGLDTSTVQAHAAPAHGSRRAQRPGRLQQLLAALRPTSPHRAAPAPRHGHSGRRNEHRRGHRGGHLATA